MQQTPILTSVRLRKKFTAFYENHNFVSSGIMQPNVSNASRPSPVGCIFIYRMSSAVRQTQCTVMRYILIMKDELETIWKVAVGYCPLEQLSKAIKLSKSG
jgi:hypothetical protein